VAVCGAPYHNYRVSVTCHMGSHGVTFHPTQVNTFCCKPSQTGR